MYNDCRKFWFHYFFNVLLCTQCPVFVLQIESDGESVLEVGHTATAFHSVAIYQTLYLEKEPIFSVYRHLKDERTDTLFQFEWFMYSCVLGRLAVSRCFQLSVR